MAARRWLVLLVCMGCNSLAGLGELEFAGPGGGAGGPGGASGGGSGGSGADGGAGGDGGSGGQPALSQPLRIVGDRTPLTLEVVGAFRVDLITSARGLIDHYWDLAADSPELLGSGSPMHDYLLVSEDDSNWQGWDTATSVTIFPEDRRPVSYSVRIAFTYPGIGLDGETEWTLFASGRVHQTNRVYNPGGALVTMAGSEHLHGRVNPALEWESPSQPYPAHRWFWRLGGSSGTEPTILLVNRSNESPVILNDAFDAYWDVGGFALAAGDDLVRDGTMHLSLHGVSEVDLANLELDDRDTTPPDALVGCVLTDDGFDDTHGVYALTAKSSSLAFRIPTPSAARVAPAFTITDWPGTSFAITLGDQLLVTDEMTDLGGGPGAVGHGALAVFDAAAQELHFMYVGTVPESAPTADRTFHITAR